MFLNKFRNIFASRETNFGTSNGETFVSTTMFPQHCFLLCGRVFSGLPYSNPSGVEFLRFLFFSCQENGKVAQ